MSARLTLMIWPSGPSTPPEGPDRPDDDPATCLDGCGLPYEDRDGAPCPCHEPIGLAA